MGRGVGGAVRPLTRSSRRLRAQGYSQALPSPRPHLPRPLPAGEIDGTIAAGRRADPGGGRGWESQASPDTPGSSEILPRRPCRQARSWATRGSAWTTSRLICPCRPSARHIWTGCGDLVRLSQRTLALSLLKEVLEGRGSDLCGLGGPGWTCGPWRGTQGSVGLGWPWEGWLSVCEGE